MNLNNIYEGQVFDNYPALCAGVCGRTVTGKAKQLQLKELSKYIKFRREGHKYIIEKILAYPDDITDSKSNSIYIKLIETLLAAYLVGENSQSIEVTYKQLCQTLSMVSNNYQTIYTNESYKYIHDNIAPISKDIYLDFRKSTYKENKRKIKSALDSMQKQALIQYSEEIYVCCEDERGVEQYRKPTDAEMVKYLEICRELFDKYDCKDIDEISEKHLRYQFDTDLIKKMKERLNWKYKYKKIKIINGITDNVKQLEKSKQDLILQARKEKIEINKSELNQAIKKMINKIGESNYNNATKKLEEWERGDEDWGSGDIPKNIQSLLYRTKGTYLPAWNILSEYYISGNEETAKEMARDYPSSS